MGTANPRSNLQRLLESKRRMADQLLVPSKPSFTNDLSWGNQGRDVFQMNNAAMASETGAFVERQNMVFRNQSSSTVRESSVITKTVVRKKTMMINGEIVEQEEEETEQTQPTNREMVTNADCFFGQQNIKQGSSMKTPMLRQSFSKDENDWKAMEPGMFPPSIISNRNPKWTMDPSNKMFPMNSTLDMDQNFSNMDIGKMFNGSMEGNSMSFKSAMRTQKMTAFQSSINGKVNDPVVNMESNTIMYDSDLAKAGKKGQLEIEDGKTNVKAIEPSETVERVKKTNKVDDGKKTSVFEKLGFVKKKDLDYKENMRINKIIEELLTTELNYIEDMRKVVEEYMVELTRPDAPKDLVNDKYSLFGCIEQIYMFHDVQFRIDLNDCEKTPNGVAHCFLKHGKEFALYRHYNRNKPSSEIQLSKHQPFFQRKTVEIEDNSTLASHLIKPTQRIGRYILLLNEIEKECKKNKYSSKDLGDAVKMLQTEIKFGNDLMALDALTGLPEDLDIKGQGDLIYRDKFTVSPPIKGSKYEAMIFLFKEMIIISDVQLKNNIDTHHYKDHIPLSEVGLTECDKDKNVFKIWYLSHNKKNYTLHTKPEIKKLWVAEIRKTLENELQKMKKLSRKTMDEINYIDLNKRKYIDIDLNVKKK